MPTRYRERGAGAACAGRTPSSPGLSFFRHESPQQFGIVNTSTSGLRLIGSRKIDYSDDVSWMEHRVKDVAVLERCARGELKKQHHVPIQEAASSLDAGNVLPSIPLPLFYVPTPEQAESCVFQAIPMTDQ